MNFIKRDQSKNIDEENPYWMSFSDMMAGLLVVFILASTVLILELSNKNDKVDKQLQELKKAESVRKDILQEIKHELNVNNIPVEIADNDTVLRIPESTLAFDSNQYLIPNNILLRDNLALIGEILFKRIMYENRWQYLDTIFIEGHTDTQPIKRFENGKLVIDHRGNWDLSTRRAVSVWSYWTEELNIHDKLNVQNRMKTMLNHDNKQLFSVSGYADTRLADGCLSTNYQCHRRIDIRITVKKPTEEALQKIKQEVN